MEPPKTLEVAEVYPELNVLPHPAARLGERFGKALEAARWGKKIARKGWEVEGMYITATDVDEDPETGELILPYLILHRPPKKEGDPPYCYPHVPNHHDILAEDWFVINEEPEILDEQL